MDNLFKKIELFILTLAIMSLIVLVCIQFINIKDDNIINTTKFNDGIKYVPLNNMKEMDSGILILKLIDSEQEDIKVLVNGEVVSDFLKKDEIEINVSNNDLIEIDGTRYMEKNTIKVIGISKNIESPKLNTTVSTSQSIEILGKVKLK
ncbi:hypothetical protein FYJ27_04105 [Anaerosalibacter bizertensis]|uniref:Uncharacterized protein n=1 Tax=Anaerosalibacter bizertensis TaxID=932217 RepID=A0A844FFX8_9FIRM|nr:hypothetical protein [Anaerosalibacter bizertensis]MBV1818467.1 hypothetical protein [Bacteroidales bacterium MSK.15.36]HHV27712.1 hypothetical protein [Tissierellia bacterium]MBU5293207.1 hypothetical protein [Anaerosalibacter bizertensis]MCB5559685.1 hypothetical protein [Anaerosalibacter bizertensis]MCG4564276.1 hypothetical protein [Anaerosalibacter bizertensis]